MCLKIFLITYSLLAVTVDSTFFDQSQSGDLNVQVDVKGFNVIALMKSGKEEYVDYDYAYDYSEMTIKPQNRTTPRPLNLTSTTVGPELHADENVTIATTVLVETSTATTRTSEIAGVTLQQTVNHDNSTIKNIISYFNVTDPPAIKLNTTTIVTTTAPTSNSTTPITTCRKGFVLNNKGDCELKLQGTGNALLKLVKLSQKLKLRRENKRDNTDLN